MTFTVSSMICGNGKHNLVHDLQCPLEATVCGTGNIIKSNYVTNFTHNGKSFERNLVNSSRMCLRLPLNTTSPTADLWTRSHDLNPWNCKGRPPSRRTLQDLLLDLKHGHHTSRSPPTATPRRPAAPLLQPFEPPRLRHRPNRKSGQPLVRVMLLWQLRVQLL